MNKPRIRVNKEYESTLHEFRLARGLTIRELVELSGVNQNTISGLANGSISPLYVHKNFGGIKPYAKKLAKTLGASMEDLFPRYFCAIIKNELLDEQVWDLSHSENPKNPVDILCSEEVFNVYRFCWEKLKLRQREVLTKRMTGYYLDEIGVQMGITKERVRQIEKKGLGAFKKLVRQWRE